MSKDKITPEIKTEEAKTPRSRTTEPTMAERVPVYLQKRISAHTRPGFYRRFVNENRVQMFLNAGYTLVTDVNALTTNIDQMDGSDLGSAVSQVVNHKYGTNVRKAYLMEIPQEIYDRDQKAKAAENKSVLEHLDPSTKAQDGVYGKITFNDK